MNLLVVGRFHQEAFGLHILETLKNMGHNPIKMEMDFNCIGANKNFNQVSARTFSSLRQIDFFNELFIKNFFRTVKSKSIDLIIVTHDFLYPKEVELLKEKTKAKVVIWFPDAISNFSRACFLNADYDFLFFKDPYIVELLSKKLAKSNIYYLPECCNPKKHYKVNVTQEDLNYYGCDITCAGTLHSYRVSLFSSLDKYDIKLWGAPPPLWMDTKKLKRFIQNKPVMYEEKSKAFQCAKIVINNLHPAEVFGVNVRTFEILSCGGFQLVDSRKAIKDLFVDNQELVTFDSMDDLKSKIDYYLLHEKERGEIALNGMNKVHAVHTYENRLNQLIEISLG